MAGVNVSREDDRFFYLQSPSGKELPVAKKGLSADRQKFYRGLIGGATANPQQTSFDSAFDAQGPVDKVLMPSQLNIRAPEIAPVEPVAPVTPPQLGAANAQIPMSPQDMMPQAAMPQAAMPQMGGLIPAAQSVTQDISPGIQLSPDVEKDIREGYQKQADAAIAQQEAATKFKEGFAKANVELDKELKTVEAEYNVIESERANAVNKVKTDYERLTQEFSEKKVDPDRYYGNSTGKRVMAGIAIGLGELGRALTGGSQNAALNIINAAIDRDIAAQESEIRVAGQRATMARQMMFDVDKMYDDKVQATNMKRSLLLEQAERKAIELSRYLKTDAEIAQAQSFIGQLQMQKAEALAKVQQIEADKSTIRTTTQLASPAAAAGEKSEKVFDQASKLRNEYNKNPVTLETGKRKSSLNSLKAAKEQDSAGGDLAFIFSYMKMLDPGSVVREGEFANAQNAAGVPDRIRNLYNKTIDGKRLNPEQREDFYNTANALYQKQLIEQRKVDKRYEGLSKRSGIDPIDVIIIESPEDRNPEEISSTFVPSGRR